ncbi:MAG TPA: prepilin-type N-terminal cleavage/methylation domain-containing protein [Phycisphaerae bacterium]|nr:prepilin-type N-terminal cleavage/methylation domain-containing protein [Phycisphaerae bacterium]HRY66588.1 prepilin-type N-terminal cleavage/methylation domain-containing protein [Phycisphaerae bacterium]HSA27008.1 prepilin-type N-terminal cleavage/methylation domain-containing protein [Phycisphaerae bacterium]
MDTLARRTVLNGQGDRIASLTCRVRLPRATASPRHPGRGFTLIEILVVVAIIALLLAVLLPALTAAKEAAQRVGCQANMHSMGQAMAFYAEDHQQQYYMFNRSYNFSNGTWDGPEATIADDSAVALALDMKSVGKPGDPGYVVSKLVGAPSKKYLRDWNTLICPGTRNKIRNATDLNNNADNRISGPTDGKYGHSYELWNGFQKSDFAGPGPVKVGATRRLYSSSSEDTDNDGFPDCLKRPRIVAKRATNVILVVDGDDSTNGADANNFPDDQLDNHGHKGWNMLFADTHARWITPTQTWQTLHRSDMSVSGVPAAYWPKDVPPPPGP